MGLRDCPQTINPSDSETLFEEISSGFEVAYATGAVGASKADERSRKGIEEDRFRVCGQSLGPIFRGFLLFATLTTSAYAVNSSSLYRNNMKDWVFDKKAPYTLCVEIGGKQTIAALLPLNPTLQDLQNAEILNVASKPWFSQLPLLFTSAAANPFLSLIKKPHSQISVSIFGPLFKNEGLIDVARRHLPPEISSLCKETSERPLIMFTDTICWATGCLEYYELKALEPISFPFVAIILKTGIGIALVEDGKVSAIEIPYIGCTFPALETLCTAQGQPFKGFNVHQALGNGFFDWILKKRDFADSEMDQYLDLYNARFHVFVNELSAFIREHLAVDVKSIYVGGENSKFIRPFARDHSTTLPSITVLNGNALAEDGIAPETIQLLGCLKLSQTKDLITETYPSYDEIIKQLPAN